MVLRLRKRATWITWAKSKPANFRSLSSKFSRFTVLLFLWMVG